MLRVEEEEALSLFISYKDNRDMTLNFRNKTWKFDRYYKFIVSDEKKKNSYLQVINGIIGEATVLCVQRV